MQKDTCSQMNTTTEVGSYVFSKVPKTNTSIYTKSPHLMSTLTTNTINRYGVLPSPYEKEPLPVAPWSDNSDCVPSDASVLNNRFSSDTDKFQGCYPHVGVIMSPKNYFGHIRIKRYDFINEEPYGRKDKSMKECPVHGFASRDQQEGSRNQGEVNTRGSEESNSDNFYLQSPNQDIIPYVPDDNQMLDMRNISNGVADETTPSHLPNTFHWPGCSPSSDASFSSSDDLERLMGIMNSHYTSSSLLPMPPKPTLPGIGSFASPFQYMMPNPFFPPVMYPGSFDGPAFPPPPFLDMQSKFHPFSSGQYNWMQERSRDLAASIFPTVIRPKAMDGTRFAGPEEQTQSPMPHHLPYPSPAAMFRAANLIPPFYLSRRENTTTRFTPADGETLGISSVSVAAPSTECISASATKKPVNSMSTSFYSQTSTCSSQTSPMKPDNLFSYTLAADPSDVMRYVPNTSSGNYDEVGPIESDDEDGMYTQGECDDGVCYPYRERFSEVDESKEVKNPIPPSRKSHVCEICGKTYARAFTLKTHQRIHTGEKPYQCKVCKRSFAQGSGLESHMRVHTGEKPYKCLVCCRAFSHSSAVKSHLRTHTGEKPYRCDLCGKYFGDQSTLKKHTRVHTGEKPFKCSICNLTFTQVGNMNKHLKNVHAEDKSV